MMDARETARRAREATSFDDAVALIQSFADREANAAAVRAIQGTSQSVSQVLGLLFDSPLHRDQRKQGRA
jgi:hypothetical protein